ncbi:hypothetical protein [Microbacterium laevaniformans]|uniref:hypothetical protein n=1 Tax=Microbacterium laevaniformans TaxID=36807 RepID=UPI003D96DF83
MTTAAIAPSSTRRIVASKARHDAKVTAADTAIADAGAALWTAIVARLNLATGANRKAVATAAIMLRGALAVFRRSNGVLKGVMALVVVGMVGDWVTYPTTIWAVVEGGSRAAFGMGVAELLAIIPPQFLIGYLAVLTALILAVVGVVKLARKLANR